MIVYSVASILVVVHRAIEKAARRDHTTDDAMALDPVLGDGCALVKQLRANPLYHRLRHRDTGLGAALENRVMVGSDKAMAEGRCLQDMHAAVEDAHL